MATINGTNGADELQGGAEDDVFNGGAGDDHIDGGAGANSAQYAGNLNDYALTNFVNGSVTVSDLVPGDGDEGSDTLRQVQTLEFADATLTRELQLEGSVKPPTVAWGLQVVALEGGGFLNVGTSGYDPAWTYYAADGAASAMQLIPQGFTQWTVFGVALSGGGAVVVWTDSVQSGVSMQRVDGEGDPVGGPVRLTLSGRADGVTELSDGGFAVLYMDGTVQRYSAEGVANGGPIDAAFDAEDESGALQPTHIAALEDGGFVVMWASRHVDDATDFLAQAYDASGNEVGPQIAVDSTFDSAVSPDWIDCVGLTSLVGGGYLINWSSGGYQNDGHAFVQIVDADGVAVGGPITIEDSADNGWAFATAAAPDGGFVAVWTGANGVFFSRFDASGSRMFDPVRVSDSFYFGNADIAMLEDGLIVINWRSVTGGNAVLRFNPDGQPVMEWDDIASIDANDSSNEISYDVTEVDIYGNGGDDTLSAGTYNDLLDGGDGNDTLDGGAGIDSLRGGAGNDYLDGGAGGDGMLGGAGDDVYIVDHISDLTVESAAGGTDEVRSSITHTLSANVENLVLTGTANIEGTGNALSNDISGNSGNNTLNGAAGADEMTGGAGDDTYIVESVGDVVVEAVGGGRDTVRSSISYALASNVENLVLTGSAALNGTGNQLDNDITGNSGDNTLIGGAGNDILRGGAGSNAATYAGAMSDFSFDDFSNGNIRISDTNVADGDEGSDLLTHIETINFADAVYTRGHQAEAFVEGSASIYDTASIVPTNDGGFFVIGELYSTGWTRFGADGSQWNHDDTPGGSPVGRVYATRLSDGDVIAMWNEHGSRVEAQLLDGDGEAAGPVILLAQNVTAWNVAALNDNNFAVLYSNGTVQRYGADGNPLDAAIDVRVSNNGNPGDIAALDGGGFVVFWTRFEPTGGQPDFRAQRYDDSGQEVGGEFTFTSPLDGMYRPSRFISTDVTGLEGGGYVITWSFGEFSQGADVYAQIVASDGSAVGGPILIEDTGIDGGDPVSTAATDDGGFVTLWRGEDGMCFTRYDAEGVRLFDPVLVSSAWVSNANIAVLDNGLIVVNWEGTGGRQILRFHADGQPVMEWDDTAVIQANAADNELSYGVSAVEIHGNAGDDALSTGEYDDVLDGGAGNDYLDGGAGGDEMRGGSGDDVFIVEDHGDVIVEAAAGGVDEVRSSVSETLAANVETLLLTGADDINGTGNELANTITGNGGANTLNGAAGADVLFGKAGDDIYIVDAAGDVLNEDAGEGVDFALSSVSYALSANVENLILTGAGTINGTGNGLDNSIEGNVAANVLSGGGGNDTLDGGMGNDDMHGGSGNDIYVIDSTLDEAFEAVASGTDTARSVATWTLAANIENLTLEGGAHINGTGNSQANVILGNTGNNTLDGGGGADALRGGFGNDIYIVDNAGDIVTEEAASGNDTVHSQISYALSANVENLTLTGSGNINGTGNILNNVLIGNSGINTLAGGLGNDIYVLNLAGDTVVEGVNAGVDLVRSALTHTLAANVENLTLVGTANLNGIGNVLNNVLIGNSGNNVLNGGTGNDRLEGGAGNDTFIFNGGDVIVEALNAGADTVRSTVSYTLGANVENLVLIGAGALNGTGNGLNNVITGNADNNTLDGYTGSDRLEGGAGNDLYIVNDGDTVVELAGAGIDTVRSSSNYSMSANVENLVLVGGAHAGTGNALNNIITGHAGMNILDGLTGFDRLEGGAGDDRYITDGGDTLVELAGGGTDTVVAWFNYTLGNNLENLIVSGNATTGTGNALANTISGNALANTLNGGAGDDRLQGGLGNDVLIGGTGSDTFLFNAALSGQFDRITDFNVVADTIMLDDDVFIGLFVGSLAASAFRAGSAAADADDRIIYNTNTGQIFYDANGNGAGGMQHFATVSAGTLLTAADFQVTY